MRDLSEEYFSYLCNIAGVGFEDYDFSFLMKKLYFTEFEYTITLDKNRLSDGLNLRNRFLDDNSYDRSLYYDLDFPCSVLEVMLALSIRCEEYIMDNPNYGDRTRQWFWKMINSLGLGGMYNILYDERKVDDILRRFLSRRYSRDGQGGLFTIKGCDRDLRDVEIWCQMCWYLNRLSD